MGGEGLGAERIVVRQQRRYLRHHQLDVGLPHVQLDLLVEQRHHVDRVNGAAVYTGQRDRPAATHHGDRRIERGQPVDSRVLHHCAAHRRSGNPAAVCATVAIGEPWASMPTASMTESAPRPSVESRTTSMGSSRFMSMTSLHISLQTFGNDIDADDPAVPR